MDQSLQVDPDLLRAQHQTLAAIADAAQANLDELKARLAREGKCWGNDEPGRKFGENYEPAAKSGITGFENLVDNLRGMRDGMAQAADSFQSHDQESGLRLARSGFDTDPTTPLGQSVEQPMRQNPGLPQSTAPLNGDGSSPDTSQAAPPGSEIPTTPYRSESQGLQPSGNPGASSPPESAGHSESGMPLGQPARQMSGSDTPAIKQTRTASAAPVPSPAQAVAAPATSTARPGTAAGHPAAAAKSRDTPWSRPRVETSGPRSTPGTPWLRNTPAGSAQGQVFAPHPGPEQRRAKPEQPNKSDESRRSRSAPARPKRTAPAALDVIRELAARHGLRIAGFETSGIEEHTAREIAAAVDDILGKYPFLDLRGIEIADLGGTVSDVVWNRDDARTAAWLVLDRISTSNGTQAAEMTWAATEFRDLAADSSDERPMYSTVARDLGRILESAAGPRIRQLAQRALITEYHRVSGPWDRNDTLAGVVRGYRGWCAQLSGRSFSGNRFDPGAALVEAFAEVELRGENACGPAKVLHRLLVENARARSGS
ncbi:hypothetical protein [Nocardia sp. NPDC052112]|uniref:WXG100 family type VII secretion target n=1 Tax=Nocardia sp. NPDC052112 TaxID=3155646 RepID=UPI00341682F5